MATGNRDHDQFIHDAQFFNDPGEDEPTPCTLHCERCEIDGCPTHDGRTLAQIAFDRAERMRREDEADDRFWLFATTSDDPRFE